MRASQATDMPHTLLHQKNAVVTGASRGIGFSIASGFARAGADVLMLADDAAIHEASSSIAKQVPDRSITGLQCDITDKNTVAKAMARCGRIDILVNNAGLERMTPIDSTEEYADELFARIIEINVLGTYYVTKAALPYMDRGSRIVITASIWSKTAVARFSAYCASKHANLGFMRSLAQELGPRGIAVNAVCPGFIETTASLKSLRDEAAATGLSEADVRRDLLSRQAFPGLLQPNDVVSAYLFLASDEAMNITGQSLHVDRGDVMD